MATDRREFIRGTAWMGATAMLAGCVSQETRVGGVGRMTAFAASPLKKVRVGHVGLGQRGPGAVHRMAAIPGMEVAALCDLYPERVARQQVWLKENKKPAAREYSGEEGYKALCASDIDLVYVTTPWASHAEIALYAMEHGKHVVIEVPAAMTIDECWALVETSERTGRHCMQLENCCYGEAEMLALNMVRKGVLGEIFHAEGAYIHDLRDHYYQSPEQGSYQGYWRLKWNTAHYGNPYPTHGLVPVMQTMNINRGDRFDYLNCVQCDQRCMDEFAVAKFGHDSWQARLNPRCGDMSTTIIRTVNGKSLMVQHNVNTPRPYRRHNILQGTRGIFTGIEFPATAAEYVAAGNPVQFGWESKTGQAVHKYFGWDEMQKFRAEYKHPLWKAAGEFATKVGGHGGMDFLMDLRLAYCLQNGLPLDMSVYDLAASCSLCELSERSVLDRGSAQDVPDFTRGAWKTAQPLGIESVDLSRMGTLDVKTDKAALNV